MSTLSALNSLELAGNRTRSASPPTTSRTTHELPKPGGHVSLPGNSNEAALLPTGHSPTPKSPQPTGISDPTALQAPGSPKLGWPKPLMAVESNAGPPATTIHPQNPESPPPQLIPSAAAAQLPEHHVALDHATLEALRAVKPGFEKSMVCVDLNAAATSADPTPTQAVPPAAAAPDLFPQTSNALSSLNLPPSLEMLELNMMSSGDMQPAAATMLDVAASEALNLWGSRTLPSEQVNESQTSEAALITAEPRAVQAVPPPFFPSIPEVGEDLQSNAPQMPKVWRSALFTTLSAVPDLEADLPEDMMSLAKEESPATATGPVVSKLNSPIYMC